MFEKINKITIDEILNSKEYKEKLKETLVSIIAKTKAATTEASIASIFENEIFYFIKMFLGKDITFEKEVGQEYLKRKICVFRGRMDAVANDLVIEYKRSQKLTKESDKKNATKQVEEYLIQLNEKNSLEYNAILTDGQKIRYFYYLDRALHYTPFKEIETEDLDKLVRSLVNVENKKFVPDNIINDFKFESKNNITRDLALSLFDIVQNSMTEKTDMLFQEWQELFHLSENDRGKNLDIEKRKAALGKMFNVEIADTETDYKALFVLQTTYAIIVKLIACKVISKISGSSQEEIVYFSDLAKVNSEGLRQFMESLEEGYTFSIGGIRNLLEGDFFSWYSDENQWNDKEGTCIKKIINTLEGYSINKFSYGYLAIDIFKDLYMEIMPNEVRHSLGEYFTPSWLADYVIKNSSEMVKESDWRAIDPCCGSGIFIVSLIKHVIGKRDIVSLSHKEKKALLKEIVNRVQGIDINPLSVLTARVSYLWAISPLLEDETVEIPIYLGDSANIPKIVFLKEVKCYQYIISTKQGEIEITLPCSFVEEECFLERMSLLQTIIKAESEILVYEKLISYIPKHERNQDVLDKISDLSLRLVELHKNKWDGIWLRIVTNYMLVARIKNIDIIVGNPPWVKWEYLPQMYAEKIKSLCLDRHIFSGQTYMGAISLNICALISNVTASSWLKPDGVLAFLMPKTLMTQDSYAGFRNFYIDINEDKRLFLQKADDWSKSGNPFVYTTEKFLTYYYKNKFVDYSKGLPVKYFEKKRGIEVKQINSHSNFEEVKQYFNYKNGKAYQLDANRTGFTMIESESSFRTELYGKIIGQCEYKARSGVEFTPAEIYFVKPKGKSASDKRYKFTNSEFKNSIYKAISNNGFEIEKEFVKPVIKSPCITEFGIIDNDNYCIFPYKEGMTESISLKELSQDYDYLANYFINYKKLIDKQSERSKMIAKGNDFYALSKVGRYTYGDFSVTFRDNTKMVATVVKPIVTPWGSKVKPICAKHSPYISMDKKGRFINKEEAYFICGILNTNVVQEYFKFTFSGRSYSIDFNIYIPLYDSENELHKGIVELSQKAHKINKNIREIQKIKKQIENLYMQICEDK
ncbi:MAG: hypothetical protein HDT39_01435 [Lachnospiraceae bacterium]|nr:hypothetical protein [Lachnospiraceae bacterium]